MAFYSLGKNEARFLMQKEAQMKSELHDIEKASLGANNISSFKMIRLKSEIQKIQNKLRVLSAGSDFDGDDIA